MTNPEIIIGQTYTARVGERIVPIRVDSRAANFTRKGGARWHWSCTNLRTGRTIVVRSAQRFRGHVPADQVAARLEVLH